MSLGKFFLILDVDGVTRRGVSDVADPIVAERVQKLLALPQFLNSESKLAFVSGSQVLSGSGLPEDEWRGRNVGLLDVFKGVLPLPLLQSGKCSVYGQVGADRLVVNPATNDLDGKLQKGFTIQAACTGLNLMVETFLDDCTMVAEERGLNKDDIEEARRLLHDCTHSKVWEDEIAVNNTHLVEVPDVMAPVANFIREKLDPHYRMICNGGTLEAHASITEIPVPAKGPCRTVPQVAEDVTKAVRATKLLSDQVAEISIGIAHRAEVQFRYYVLILTTKGHTVTQLRAEYPDHTFLTIGDGHIDYSMHRIADYSFHVGPRSVWETEQHRSTEVDRLTDAAKEAKEANAPGTTGSVEHVVLVTCGGDEKKDMQLTEGTAAVLDAFCSVVGGGGDEASLNIDDVVKALGTRVVKYE